MTVAAHPTGKRTFLMEHESMSYPEALRWLAARYQIEIESG